MQPRSKSSHFSFLHIRLHAVTVVFYLFLPQSCHKSTFNFLSLQSAPASIVKHHLPENLSCFLKVAPPNDLYSQTTLAAKIATASPSGIPIDRIGRQVRHLASTETPLRD